MAETVEVLLTEFRADIKRYEAALRRQVRETEKASAANRRAFERSNRAVVQSTDRMSRDVRRAIAAIALGAGVREAVRWGEAYTDAANKIAAAGQIAGIEARALDALAASAGAARSEIAPYVDLYARLLRVSPEVAATEEQVAKATDLVAKAFKAGGASAQEQAAGIIQLGQALGSGFLQGDELRSIRENAPLVAQAIAREFDTTISGLKELGAEGELVNDRVFTALLNSAEDIEAAFGATIPSATDATTRSWDRLTLRVGQYITESDTVRAGSDGLARILDFVADNLDTLTDAVIVASAAIGAGGLTIAMQRAYTAMMAGIASAGGLRAALVSLRAVAATLAFPAALAIAAGTLAAMALNAESAAERMGKIRRGFEVLAGLRPAEDIGLTADEMKRLSELTDEALASVEGLNDEQREAIRLTRLQNQAMEAQAILRRREAIDDLTGAMEAARDETIRLYRELENDDELRVTNYYRRQAGEGNLQDVEPADGQTRAEAIADALEAADFTEQAEKFRELNARIRETQALMAGLEAFKSGALVQGDPTEGLASAPASPSGAGAGADLAAIEEIANAHRAAFETEREQIARLRDERLAAIDDATMGEEARAEARRQTEELYQRGMQDLRAQEQADFDAFIDEELAKADAVSQRYEREREWIAELERQRNEVAGRALTNIEAEYDARRDAINSEIQDVANRNEALAILEEEYAARREQIRTELLGTGTSSDDEIERVRATEALKLEVLQEALDLEYITLEEHAARKLELEQATEDEIQAIRAASVQMQLQNGEKLFNGLAGMAQAFGGRQSSLYKTLFAVEKAFATASALVSIQQGLANALSLPWPANLAAFAQVAALGATVVSNIASVSANFADGGIDIRGPGSGRSDSIPAYISRGESVITARGTANNAGLLSAINAGADVEGQIASMRTARQIAIGGTTLIVEGDIATQAAFDRLQAQIDAGNSRLADEVNRIVAADRLRTTPRHRR